jgi:hypothetical protein
LRQLYVFLSCMSTLVNVMLNHRVESAFVIHILIDVFLIKVNTNQSVYFSLIFGEQAHRKGGCDHDIWSLHGFSSLYLLCLVIVIDASWCIERLLLCLDLIFVQTLFLRVTWLNGIFVYQFLLEWFKLLPCVECIVVFEFILLFPNIVWSFDEMIRLHELVLVSFRKSFMEYIVKTRPIVLLFVSDLNFLGQKVYVFERIL